MVGSPKKQELLTFRGKKDNGRHKTESTDSSTDATNANRSDVLHVSNQNSGSSWSTPSERKDRKVKKKSAGLGRLNAFGTLLRTLLLDIPLVVLFALYCSGRVLQKIRDDFLLPQLELQRWTEERADQEITYYHRHCEASDTTANDTEPLIVTDDMDTNDAVEHMLTHGAQVYPNLLSPETAKEIRDFILAQNLKNEDMIDVIENTNRWSFFLRVDQHPSVAKALNEVLTKPKLVAAMEKIMGKNPAVIEFTGITSAFGATDQRWHEDIVPEGSGAKYSRNFIPSYSLFIPLQNITKAMGATEICPGTHMCADGPNNFCLETGFPMSGKADNWPMGWGALVNQQTNHRGAAHMDPNGPERVLFIITFAPRPRFGKQQVETRMISTGGSYSLHWSQWGHTLKDFQNANRYMLQPWRSLRAMGIYKPPGSDWGWDYVSESSGRIANDGEEGFTRYHYDKFMEDGGFKILPSWLYGEVSKDEDTSDVWIELYSGTLDRCTKALMFAYLGVLGIYTIGVFVINGFLYCAGYRQRSELTIGKSISRLVLLHCLVSIVAWGSLKSTSKGTWAKNVKGGRMYSHPKVPRGPDLPSTLPLLQDILVPDDLQSEYFASFTRILDFAHPGNKKFQEMKRGYAVGYHMLSSSMQQELDADMVRWLRQEQSRILAKNSDNAWGELEGEEAEFFCHKELMKSSNPFVEQGVIWTDYLLAETKFGYWRDTAMHVKTIPAMLRDLQFKLLRFPDSSKSNLSIAPASEAFDVAPGKALSLQSSLPILPKAPTASFVAEKSHLPPEPPIVEPYPGAWLREDDVVEGKYRETYGEWYRGRITAASADRLTWDVEYDDEDSDLDLCLQCVRRFVPYAVGEKVESRDGEGDNYVPGRIIKAHPDDETYNVRFDSGDVLLKNVPVWALRRITPPNPNQFRVGSPVLGLFGEGEEWFPGKIVQDNGDGTFAVQYEDGDYDARLEGAFLQPRP